MYTSFIYHQEKDYFLFFDFFERRLPAPLVALAARREGIGKISSRLFLGLNLTVFFSLLFDRGGFKMPCLSPPGSRAKARLLRLRLLRLLRLGQPSLVT